MCTLIDISTISTLSTISTSYTLLIIHDSRVAAVTYWAAKVYRDFIIFLPRDRSRNISDFCPALAHEMRPSINPLGGARQLVSWNIEQCTLGFVWEAEEGGRGGENFNFDFDIQNIKTKHIIASVKTSKSLPYFLRQVKTMFRLYMPTFNSLSTSIAQYVLQD